MNNESSPSKLQWLSIKDAAEYLDVGEQTLYRWMREGKITHRKVGDSIRFLQEDLDAVIHVFPSQKEADKGKEFCPFCHHSETIEGTAQSTGRVMFRPKKTRFWTFEEANLNVEARMCPRCGGIFFKGDTSKLERLRNPMKESLKTGEGE
jgi:excisionase family DNA binding protein